jgi:hypothetical protein
MVPFIASNVVALLLLITAIAWPRTARVAFVVIFLAAGVFNAYTAFTTPESYLMYGEMALLPFYQAFIYGFFAQNTTALVLLIAAGQIAVGALLANRGFFLRLGVLGAIVFLAAIAPLGVGSAFPFSLIAIVALLVMQARLRRRRPPEPPAEPVPA